MKHATDTIKIDLIGKSVSAGRTMTQKRTLHNLRTNAKSLQRDFWARWYDEMYSMYLSGRRGNNADFIESDSFTGFAGNAFAAPDSDHQLFGTGATAYNDITSADKMDLALIDRAVTKATTMGGGSTNIPRLRPMKVNGEDRFVCLMHPFQWHDLKVNTSTGQWLDIQKAAAGAQGASSPIFRGNQGMYNGVVLHVHNTVTTAADAGAGANVATARALFLGRQAGAVAFGSPGAGMRLSWREDIEDRGREMVVTVETIVGIKKTRWTVNSTARDFGVMALDTYAAAPA
jgi:N4-gp56 family major capsid protein